jgi:hypothetical protein
MQFLPGMLELMCEQKLKYSKDDAELCGDRGI